MAITSDVYDLSQIEFIGGTSQYLDFTINDEAGLPLNLDGSTCEFKLRDFGNFGETGLLSKDGVITSAESGQFRVALSPTDTNNLYGKFVYQIKITDVSLQVFRFQGIMLIFKAIL